MSSPGHDLSVMNASQAEEFVIALLKDKGPLTTMEIEKLARKEHKRCPDQTVIFLTKMRKKGMIMGEASMERRGWVWWHEDEGSRLSSVHKSA